MDHYTVIKTGMRLAIHSVVAELETSGTREHLPDEPGRWYDTRPMLDPREHSGQVIDMAMELISFGEAVGALHRHPQRRHLVRVLVAAEPA